jgi:hypothetical protein
MSIAAIVGLTISVITIIYLLLESRKKIRDVVSPIPGCTYQETFCTIYV